MQKAGSSAGRSSVYTDHVAPDKEDGWRLCSATCFLSALFMPPHDAVCAAHEHAPAAGSRQPRLLPPMSASLRTAYKACAEDKGDALYKDQRLPTCSPRATLAVTAICEGSYVTIDAFICLTRLLPPSPAQGLQCALHPSKRRSRPREPIL